MPDMPLFPANDPADPGFVDDIDTDWQEEGLKTGNRQNHNVSLSGGGTQQYLQYFFGLF